MEVTFLLGSLNGFIVEVSREFFDLLDQEQTVLLGFSELSFQLLKTDDEEVVFGEPSLELFDLLNALRVGLSQLFKFSGENSNLILEISLEVCSLLELDSQLVDLKGKLSEFLILLVERVLEVLDGSHEVFDSSLESVDFSFVLSASDFEDSQLVDELVLLEQLVTEFFDGALLDEQVLLELTDFTSQGFNLSTFTDQALEFSNSEDDANGEVLILNLE